LLAPIVEYDHSGGRCSVTGGYVYRGDAIPTLAGAYVYGDFCTGEIWGLRPLSMETALFTGGPDGFPAMTLLTSFGVGPDGELYITRLDGTVRRLIPG
jgi:hypothetical protein